MSTLMLILIPLIVTVMLKCVYAYVARPAPLSGLATTWTCELASPRSHGCSASHLLLVLIVSLLLLVLLLLIVSTRFRQNGKEANNYNFKN